MGSREIGAVLSYEDLPLIVILWTATGLSTCLAYRRYKFRIEQYRELHLDLQIPERVFNPHKRLGCSSVNLTLAVPQESEFPPLVSSSLQPWLHCTDQVRGAWYPSSAQSHPRAPGFKSSMTWSTWSQHKVTSVIVQGKFVCDSHCITISLNYYLTHSQL